MMERVDDWQQFLSEVTWFLRPGQQADVRGTNAWSRGPALGLPVLTRLLEAATVTSVEVEGHPYELLAWGPAGRRRGWLCLPPVEQPDSTLHPMHQALLSLCGGIVERFGEPESWWLNQNEVWTESATRLDLGQLFEAYAWLWTEDGLTLPIKPSEYYPVAVEANGNLTLAHREDGTLLLFAPDHAFGGVTPLEGCPPYSLMTIDNAPDLAAWLETCAAAWTG